jgi:hypothetical protein
MFGTRSAGAFFIESSPSEGGSTPLDLPTSCFGLYPYYLGGYLQVRHIVIPSTRVVTKTSIENCDPLASETRLSGFFKMRPPNCVNAPRPHRKCLPLCPGLLLAQTKFYVLRGPMNIRTRCGTSSLLCWFSLAPFGTLVSSGTGW